MRRNFNFAITPFTIIIILMIVSNMMNAGNPIDWIMNKIMIIPAIIVGLSFHEFGHAFAAYRLGDNTPLNQGRVTLDPRAHIDPTGLVFLFFAGFGWGQPVEINPYNFRKPRRDQIIVGLAGVFNNLLIALMTAVILKIMIGVAPGFVFYSKLGDVVLTILEYMISVNLCLMVFNLIPVPPLDGFNVVTQIFHLDRYGWWYKYYQFGNMILMLLILFDITDMILTPCINAMWNLLLMIILG